MPNIIFEPEYEILPRLLAEQRQASGLSQRALAARMRRSQSHVQEMETGQKRIELIEFCRFIRAVNGDPHRVFEELLLRLEQAPGNYNSVSPTFSQLKDLAA